VEGKELTQTAIRFALMNSTVSSVLVGFSNISHIDEAANCSEMPTLTVEQMTELRRLWNSDFGVSS
jgi:aryl-alcohol dehydrogenase-like predicted oxidoreductase